MGTITSRQSHPISYPALPEGAFTVLAVREVGPAAAPKPRLLDRVREATRARHYSRRTEKAYVAWIRQLRGVHRLMAILLYRAGLRLLEAARVRVKDVDFARNQIMVRGGKGDKDRPRRCPRS